MNDDCKSVSGYGSNFISMDFSCAKLFCLSFPFCSNFGFSRKTPYFLNIMEETPGLFNKLIKYYSSNIAAVFTDVLNTQREELFDEFEAHLPKALYAQVKEKCLEKRCTSQKLHILTTMDKLKDSWEDGYEVVYVPAHFEKKKKGKK